MGVLYFLQIVGAVTLAYLPFAGGMSVPWTGDQKVYLSTAIEMRQQHSVLIPYLFGEPSYYKPPLQYWSTLAGWKIFGFSLWGAFIPSVLAALVAALALWSVARRVMPAAPGSVEASARSSLWFLGSVGTATFAMSAQMEIYLVALGFLAWAFALAYLDRLPADRLKNPWALYAAWLCAGVLGWVKSPLYSAFWGTGYLLLLVFRRDWREFRSLHFYTAVIFGALVGASWYLVVLGLDRERFISDYVLRETVSKGGGNASSAGMLWVALAGFCVPFALLTLGGISTLMTRPGRRLLGFLVASGLPAALFFSLYPYRVSTYLYVIAPLAAILAASFEAQRPKVARVVSRAGFVLMALGSGYLTWLSVRIGVASGAMLAGVVVLGVFGTALWVRAATVRPRSGLWAAVLLVAWMHLVGVALGERDIADLRGFVAANSHRSLAMYDPSRNIWHEVGLISVALQAPVARLHRPEEALEVLMAGGAVLVSDEQASRLHSELRVLLDAGADGREVRTTAWRRLESRRKLRLSALLRAREPLELSRVYQVMTLPAPSDWILPEGGV